MYSKHITSQATSSQKPHRISHGSDRYSGLRSCYLSMDLLSNMCYRSVCVLLVGACTGPVFDRGYLRFLLLVGSFGVVFGFMMLSLCKEFWQAMLAQGFCIGLGGGMLFVPSVAILPTYFSTKIGLAIGLAAAGSSMGGKSSLPHANRMQTLTRPKVSFTLLSFTACCHKSVSDGLFAFSDSWLSLHCSFPSSS